MVTKVLWLVPMVVVAVAQAGEDARAKKDLDAMQGTWVMQALEINGKEVSPKQLEGTTLTVKGDEYRTKVKNRETAGLKMKLDPATDPKSMDMTLSMPGEVDKVHKAIYVIDKDTIKICRGLTADKERPNQFGTWPNTNYFMVTWKKMAK